MDNIKTIFQAFVPLIKSVVKENTTNVVKRELATVIDCDNEAHTATIRLLSSQDDPSQNMVVPSVVGADLFVNELVWVDRWSTDGKTFLAVVSMTNTFDESIK